MFNDHLDSDLMGNIPLYPGDETEMRVTDMRGLIDRNAPQYYNKDTSSQSIDQLIAARRAALGDICRIYPNAVAALDQYVAEQWDNLREATDISASTKIDSVQFYKILKNHALNYKGHAHYTESTGKQQRQVVREIPSMGYRGESAQRALISEIFNEEEPAVPAESLIALQDFIITQGFLLPTKEHAETYFKELVSFKEKEYKYIARPANEVSRDASIEILLKTLHGERPNIMRRLGNTITQIAGGVLSRGINIARGILPRTKGIDLDSLDDDELARLSLEINAKLRNQDSLTEPVNISRFVLRQDSGYSLIGNDDSDPDEKYRLN